MQAKPTTPKPTQIIMNEIVDYYFKKHASTDVHDKRFVLLNYHNDKLPQKFNAFVTQYPDLNTFYSRLFDLLKKRVEKSKEFTKRDLFFDINTVCRDMRFSLKIRIPTTKPKAAKSSKEPKKSKS